MNKNKKELLKTFLYKQYLFKTILKQKKTFIYIASFLFLINCFYAFFKKPVWQGQFQIVLDTKTNSLPDIPGISPELASRLNIGENLDNLKTEVGILGSPSVLLPVFNFVKKDRDLKGKNTKNLRFRNWKKNNLIIYLEPKTSILNLDYRDTDKQIILPVISLISESYQSYSNRDRKNGLANTLEFVTNQTSKYDGLSSKAFKDIQDFALKYDLNPLKDNVSVNEIERQLDIASIRVSAANQIRIIDAQLDQIKNVNEDIYLLQYLNSVLPEFIEKNYANNLDNIERRLLDLNTKYVEDDIFIKKAKKEKELLLALIKKESISYLKGKKANAIASVESTKRPEGVLTKYQEMLREFRRYEQTLLNLERQEQFLNLEKARILEPWELITNPTILDQPVGPSKKRIIALGLFASLLAASLITILLEKINENIFNPNQ